MILTEADIDELQEIAFLATDHGLSSEAGELFDCLVALAPHRPYPRVGQGLVAYLSGDRSGAIALLKATLVDHPEAVFTRSLLAQWLKESGQPGWERYAREALERVDQGVAADTARAVLGEAAPRAAVPTSGEAESSSRAWMNMRRV